MKCVIVLSGYNAEYFNDDLRRNLIWLQERESVIEYINTQIIDTAKHGPFFTATIIYNANT